MAISAQKLATVGIIILALELHSTQATSLSSAFDFLVNNHGNTTTLTIGDELKRQDTTIPVQSREFGENCDANSPCNYVKFLECIDGKCMCLNPWHRAYDEEVKECVSLAGSGCGGNGPQCVRNSECSYGACQCVKDYGVTTSKVCLLERGKPCQPNECNGDKNLACIQGNCQCIDSLMVYNPIKGRCLDPQKEFGDYVRNVGKLVAQRVVAGKISRTVLGAKTLANGIVFLPVRLLITGLG